MEDTTKHNTIEVAGRFLKRGLQANVNDYLFEFRVDGCVCER